MIERALTRSSSQIHSPGLKWIANVHFTLNKEYQLTRVIADKPGSMPDPPQLDWLLLIIVCCARSLLVERPPPHIPNDPKKTPPCK